MARKTAIVTSAPPKHYADWPECLPRYKWLVEDALKGDSSRMFNVGSSTHDGANYCKVCGTPVKRKDWDAHVLEHAKQLKINPKGSKASKVIAAPVVKEEPEQLSIAGAEEHPLYTDITATITDTLEEKSDETLFGILYSTLAMSVASAIVADAKEGSAGTPVLCPDCQ